MKCLFCGDNNDKTEAFCFVFCEFLVLAIWFESSNVSLALWSKTTTSECLRYKTIMLNTAKQDKLVLVFAFNLSAIFLSFSFVLGRGEESNTQK